MNWEQIAKRWRPDLVNKLQDRYGLPEEEARKKADVWLDWLKDIPSLSAPDSRARPAKLRSRSAANL